MAYTAEQGERRTSINRLTRTHAGGLESHLLIIDRNQVALALILVVEVLASVAQLIDEFAVAVEVCVQVPKKNPGGYLDIERTLLIVEQ
jgi:hypothetical protein